MTLFSHPQFAELETGDSQKHGDFIPLKAYNFIEVVFDLEFCFYSFFFLSLMSLKRNCPPFMSPLEVYMIIFCFN